MYTKEEWKTWKHLQRNGEVSYREDPQNNLGVANRPDFIRFGEFCDFRGLVLDIGVGPQEVPTHIDNFKDKATFIGIDPLMGSCARKFIFICGLGEYLPFKEGTFDQVLFVTSLDHVIDPIVVLEEAKRVLKSDGDICIWIPEKSKDCPPPIKSNEWYDNLEKPDNAEDKFHFRRIYEDVMDYEILPKSCLKIIDKKTETINKWKRNLFYKVKPI